MNHQRLSLPADLYPVETYFNWISPDDFLKALARFSVGRGFNMESSHCGFPADIAEDEGSSETAIGYIEFWTYSGNQDARLDFDAFKRIIKAVSRVEIERNPASARLIRELLDKTIHWLDDRALKAPQP